MRFQARIKDKVMSCTWLDIEEVQAARGWNELKEMLEERWRQETSTEKMEEELRNFVQKEGESMSTYARRARTLLREFNLSEENITPRQRAKNEEKIVKRFEMGVTDRKLRDILRRKACKTLDEVETYAIDQKTRLEVEAPDYEVTCNYCQTRGHRERDCRAKQVRLQKSNEAANPTETNFCNQCNNTGHREKTCFVGRARGTQFQSANQRNYGQSEPSNFGNRNASYVNSNSQSPRNGANYNRNASGSSSDRYNGNSANNNNSRNSNYDNNHQPGSSNSRGGYNNSYNGNNSNNQNNGYYSNSHNNNNNQPCANNNYTKHDRITTTGTTITTTIGAHIRYREYSN